MFFINNNSFITVDGTSVLNIIFDSKEASTLYSLDDLGADWYPWTRLTANELKLTGSMTNKSNNTAVGLHTGNQIKTVLVSSQSVRAKKTTRDDQNFDLGVGMKSYRVVPP